MRPVFAALVACFLTTHAASARADLVVAVPAEPPAVAVAAPAPPPAPKPWYGWQLLIAHAIGDALLTAGAAVQVGYGGGAGVPFFVIGGITRVGAPPILHLLHKHSKEVAYGSLALEIGTPLVGFAIARAAGPNCHPDNTPACLRRENTAMLIGALAGAVVGGVIDVAVLARGGEAWPGVTMGLQAAPNPAGLRPAKPSVSLAPLPFERGAGVGVLGVF